MKKVTEFPRKVREIEHVWIPMKDGVRLSARIWLPVDAEERPVPAILEYLPYRKRDGTVTRDTMTHPYYAGHGYAGVRVDMRGTGDSEGLLTDEYTQEELDDGVTILEWLEQQPWCDGKCGIIGISWGGFNGLQIAAMQPPQLKAIVTLCSTDDRYADDVHYMGGCLLGDNLSWASTMFGYTSLPPDPEVVGDDWLPMWRQRLEGLRPWILEWMSHQTRDKYWKHGSVCEDISRVKIPVMAVSGWADAYTNSVFRLLEDLPSDVPRCGLVGPWSHKYPHIGKPGPAIGFLQESVRWWDQHLKGKSTGIDSEPMLRAYIQEPMPPSAGYEYRHGRWVGEPSWPSPNVECRRYLMTMDRDGLAMATDGTPSDRNGDHADPLTVCSPASLGYFGGKWCSESAPPDLPDDQREDDGGALTFDGPRLDSRFEILGAPVADLAISADAPVAMVAVRLSDVLPDGRVSRLTYGLLNLTHRDGHEYPEPLEPGKRYRVKVQLNDLGHCFLPGHRIRVAISSSYWPLAWLPPQRTTLTIYGGASSIVLPVRPKQDDPHLSFPEPVCAPPTRPRLIQGTEHSWKVVRDLAAGESALEVRKGRGTQLWREINWQRSTVGFETYKVRHSDFQSASGEVTWDHGFARGDWSARCKTHTLLRSEGDHFRVQCDMDAFVRGDRIFCRSWNEKIPRDLL